MQCADAPPAFVKINDLVAVANQLMTLRLKDDLWKSADKAWAPKDEEVLRGLQFIKGATGERQIVDAAPAQTDMRRCIANISHTRFQVYGLLIKNRKHLLYDSAPDISVPQRGIGDPWLKESISGRVHDGSAAFWFVLYDCEANRVVACGRRPD
jgi:hypothetical protein